MSEPTPEFVEIVKAGCNTTNIWRRYSQLQCQYPNCFCKEDVGRLGFIEGIAKAILSVAFKQEPSEAMVTSGGGITASNEEVYRAMAAQKLRDLGIEE